MLVDVSVQQAFICNCNTANWTTHSRMRAKSRSLSQSVADSSIYLLVYTLLLFLLFGIVFYDKVDEVETLQTQLRTTSDELHTLEQSMVDIIQEEADRREADIKKRLDELNKKRELTIARSYTLLQGAEAELLEAQLEADRRMAAAQLKEKKASEDRAELEEKRLQLEKAQVDLDNERAVMKAELDDLRQKLRDATATAAPTEAVGALSGALQALLSPKQVDDVPVATDKMDAEIAMKNNVLFAVLVDNVESEEDQAKTIQSIVNGWASSLGPFNVEFFTRKPSTTTRPLYLFDKAHNYTYSQVPLSEDVLERYESKPNELNAVHLFFALRALNDDESRANKQWFVVVRAHDDVEPQQWLKALATFDANEQEYLGKLEYDLDVETHYANVDVGFALSRAALRAAAQQVDTCVQRITVRAIMASDDDESDDVANDDDKRRRRRKHRKQADGDSNDVSDLADEDEVAADERRLDTVVASDVALGNCLDRFAHIAAKPIDHLFVDNDGNDDAQQ